MKQPRKVVILGGSRTPFVKSFTKYAKTTNQDLLTAVLKDLAAKFRLEGQRVGDVAAGAVLKHSADFNLTRESVIGAGLHPDTGGYDVQRACGTSLETFNQLALKIAFGQIDSGIAGGVDTNSDVPVVYPREMGWKLLDLRAAQSPVDKLKALSALSFSDLKPIFPGVMEPRTGMSMGDHTELMVKEWKISRMDQDELALRSHKAAAAAYAAGFYSDLVFPFKNVEKDGFVRGDTTLECPTDRRGIAQT
ncbi:MAG: acetyl-CoA C-acyltransferase, partial [Bdellovibrionota bacterium]